MILPAPEMAKSSTRLSAKRNALRCNPNTRAVAPENGASNGSDRRENRSKIGASRVRPEMGCVPKS